MKAIVITEAGGPDVLQLRERETPVPGTRQILVRVAATALNRADLLQRRGLYPAPPGVVVDVPGLEYAGVVERVSSDVTEWQAGDRVMGLVGGGGYSEYVVVHEGEAIPVPEHLTLEEAAAVPEAFITAHDALFTQCHLREGETVLIHAAASGVGTAAVQLAKAAGARVIGTARSAAKLDRIRSLGADVALLPDEEWAGRVLGETGSRGVDVVLDLVGGDYLRGNVHASARRGRIIIVGLVAGREALLDLGEVLRKRLRITGTTMRARSLDEKIIVASLFTRDVFPMLAAEVVRPIIDTVLPLARAGEAHRLLEGNGTVGKVVLRVGGEGQARV